MVKLVWKKGLQFVAKDDKAHEIIVDTELKNGGFEQGFAPMDLLLVSLAGCMSMDIVAILSKKGGKITSFTAELDGIRSEEHPKYYKKIIVRFNCQGDYKKEDLLRSFELSREKYCSVSATLRESPEIEYII
jgi:putative redox protein